MNSLPSRSPLFSAQTSTTADPPACQCRHCGSPCPPDAAFCCSGCAGAYTLIHKMGLDRYYERRTIDPEAPPLVPLDTDRNDFAAYIRNEEGLNVLNLMVDGLHCAACVWLIETVLMRQKGVRGARLNMTTRRLTLRWDPSEEPEINAILTPVLRLGYRLVPYDPARCGDTDRKEELDLLVCLGISAFAAMNVMLLSVALWAGVEMQTTTRELMQWYSALIVLPSSAFALRPFARPAWDALRHGRVTMDVPITLAVILTLGMSLYETVFQSGETYFEAAASLLFFLLIGRYLDRLVRRRALSAAHDLALLQSRAVTMIAPDGTIRAVPAHTLRPGDLLLVARGEQISADGVLDEQSFSNIDMAAVTGESLPHAMGPGQNVPAGAVNLDSPIRVKVTASGDDSTLGRMARLAEQAAQIRNRYTRIADRAARWYAPTVHTLSALTFFWWWNDTGLFHTAMTNAIAVLIVTCPCALALAVPAVQVAAASALLRAGILLKNPEALEKLDSIDTVVFDKTGTLTMASFSLKHSPPSVSETVSPQTLRAAASLAAASTHPLSRALLRASGPVAPLPNIREIPGQGMEAPDGARLGSARFCRAPPPDRKIDPGPESSVLWYRSANGHLSSFVFEDTLRPDAADTVSAFARAGLSLLLLSGDSPAPVSTLAARVGISNWKALQSPEDKFSTLSQYEKNRHNTLMIGDGLNDAPSLAAAYVSMSPGSATSLTRNAADIILQGDRLGTAFATWRLARRAARAIRLNFALSIAYNVVAVPMAMAGAITPLTAALFMSASSITVMLNAMRLGRIAQTDFPTPQRPSP